IINNGTASVYNYTFASSSPQTATGTGSFTGFNMNIGSISEVSLGQTLVFGIAGTFAILNGGKLNINGNVTFNNFNVINDGRINISGALLFNGAGGKSFYINSSDSIVGSGIFKTQGTVSLE